MKADYSKMQYNRCGKSGLKLPVISLGIWHNFGHTDNYANMTAMVTTAFENGITHIDAANNYGPPYGSAEENLGRLLAGPLKGHRDELVISSKAGYDMWDGPYGNWGSRKYLIASCDQSLKRLGLDYVDIFYHHRPDPETPLEETMAALDYIVRSGRALYVGLSNYNAQQIKAASAILKRLGTPCLIDQVCYNMFDRWIENDLVDTLEEEGIGSIAFCPLAQGRLTDKYLHGIPADSRASATKPLHFLRESDITEEYLAKAAKLNALAQNRGQSLAQMALMWAMQQGRLTSVLIGASRPEQIVDNVAALSKPHFTADELAQIESILK